MSEPVAWMTEARFPDHGWCTLHLFEFFDLAEESAEFGRREDQPPFDAEGIRVVPLYRTDPEPDDREGLVEADQYVVCGMGGCWVADDYDEAREYAEEELKMLKRDPARDDPSVPIYRVSACEQVRALRDRLQADQREGDG